jgi:hypothetical protein
VEIFADVLLRFFESGVKSHNIIVGEDKEFSKGSEAIVKALVIYNYEDKVLTMRPEKDAIAIRIEKI